MELTKPSLKLWIVAGLFLASVLAFSLLLTRTLATVSLTSEGLFTSIPTLVCFFLVASLAVVFSLVVEQTIGLLTLPIAALVFALPLSALDLISRLAVGVIFLIGLLLLRSQARGAHGRCVKFSARHYRGVLGTFFFLFVFIVAAAIFIWSQRALNNGASAFLKETVDSFITQGVSIIGSTIEQMAGMPIPESDLAPAVESVMWQLLQTIKVTPQFDTPATSFAQITQRVSSALEGAWAQTVTPYFVYIPFVLAGIVILAFIGLAPIFSLVGVAVFFVVYQALVLVRVLKLAEVEVTAQRLTLN